MEEIDIAMGTLSLKKAAIKRLAGGDLVSKYPEVFNKVDKNLNFQVLIQVIRINKSQDLEESLETARMAIVEMGEMLSRKRKAINNLFPTSILSVEEKAAAKRWLPLKRILLKGCLLKRLLQRRLLKRRLLQKREL